MKKLIKKIFPEPRTRLQKFKGRILAAFYLNRCPLCATRKLSAINSNYLYYHLYCKTCDLAFVGNMPKFHEVVNKYQESYLPSRYEHLNIKNNKDEEWVGWQNSRNGYLERLGIAKLESEAPPPRRVLEIGCAEGKQMEVFINRDWEAVGIEIGEPMAEIGRQRGLNILCGEFQEDTFPDNYFDMVIMSHVIEHLLDPVRTLNICNNILKSTGWLVLETPSIPNYQDTDHMFFFTQSSLDKICKKTDFNILEHFFQQINKNDVTLCNYLAAYEKSTGI